jgi:predicted MFS family arabinose efflux permease
MSNSKALAEPRSRTDIVAETPNGGEHRGPPLSRGMIGVFAVACGLAAGNLYYAQPLLATLGRAFGVDEAAAGLVVTITQLGYAAGLLLIAPLGDLLENRRLIVTVLCGTVLALVGAACAQSFGAFVAASLAIGVTSVVAQILLPFAAHLAPPERRGTVVGQVMSGLLLGVLLARAVAGVISGAAGWRAVYLVSAGLITLTIFVLLRVLPRRQPTFAMNYGALVRSLGRIFRSQPVLRRRVAYQSALFATFSAFWTCITFLLAGPAYHLSETAIGLFALAGAVGAFFAPVAGRLGDRGHERAVTGAAFLVAAGGFALTLLQHQMWALVSGAILIDLAVQTSLVLGQRAIYALDPASRSRLNTLYIATFFCGGAVGSAVSAAAYARAGWAGVVMLGVALPLVAFVYWLSERQRVEVNVLD